MDLQCARAALCGSVFSLLLSCCTHAHDLQRLNALRPRPSSEAKTDRTGGTGTDRAGRFRWSLIATRLVPRTPCTRCSTPPHSAVSSITQLARGVTLQGRGFAPRAMNRGGAKLAVSWSFAGVQRCRLASVRRRAYSRAAGVRLACYVSDRSTCWFATATVTDWSVPILNTLVV